MSKRILRAVFKTVTLLIILTITLPVVITTPLIELITIFLKVVAVFIVYSIFYIFIDWLNRD